MNLIQVRALMLPPGIPDFLTRTRLLDAGPVTLEGRAWAGRRAEVASRCQQRRRRVVAGGVAAGAASPTLVGLVLRVAGTPGRYELWVRATDATGAVQPVEQWNYYGMGNNMVQRVEVIVVKARPKCGRRRPSGLHGAWGFRARREVRCLPATRQLAGLVQGP